MKSIFPVFLLITVFALTACQKEIVKEVVRDPPPKEKQNQGGVDDGGGGSGVNNKTLEDYAVTIYSIKEFNDYILPLIESVYQIHPRFASDMAHIALNRNWYLLPVELKKLPASLIGPGFEDKDDKFQQMAIQTLLSVYMNSLIFEKMLEQSRANLLLHEIIMGIRLMKLQGALDQCYSEIAILKLFPDKKAEYQKLKLDCELKYGLSGGDGPLLPGFGKRIDLTTEDYDNIRALVILLKTEKDLTKTQLDAWLRDKKFRSY